MRYSRLILTIEQVLLPHYRGNHRPAIGAIREVWTKRQPRASREAIVHVNSIGFYVGWSALPTARPGCRRSAVTRFTQNLNARSAERAPVHWTGARLRNQTMLAAAGVVCSQVGRIRVKVEPSPGLLFTRSSPPCDRASWREMYRPRPSPFGSPLRAPRS